MNFNSSVWNVYICLIFSLVPCLCVASSSLAPPSSVSSPKSVFFAPVLVLEIAPRLCILFLLACWHLHGLSPSPYRIKISPPLVYFFHFSSFLTDVVFRYIFHFSSVLTDVVFRCPALYYRAWVNHHKNHPKDPHNPPFCYLGILLDKKPRLLHMLWQCRMDKVFSMSFYVFPGVRSETIHWHE